MPRFIFLSPKIGFVLANSTDPDEMPHYAAFHLGHHCLPKYPFWGYWSSRVKSIFKREIAIIFLSTKLWPVFLFVDLQTLLLLFSVK